MDFKYPEPLYPCTDGVYPQYFFGILPYIRLLNIPSGVSYHINYNTGEHLINDELLESISKKIGIYRYE